MISLSIPEVLSALLAHSITLEDAVRQLEDLEDERAADAAEGERRWAEEEASLD